MRFLSRLLGTLFFLFAVPLIGRTTAYLDVVINEIAWMGNENSYSDEWIELYNNTNSQINLDGWKIMSRDGTPEINLAGIISANGYYLLERTDDNTVSDISSDQLYNGAMGNNGEVLDLYDAFGKLIDSIGCSEGWFSGDNQTKQTMERKNPLLAANQENWGKSQNPGGTPKTRNSSIETFPSPNPEEAEKPTENESLTPQNEIFYPSGVVVNEILPSPEGPDETDEWFEILNQNNFEVDLSGWKIKDSAGKTADYIFPSGTKISAAKFLVLTRPTTKITLNNDGDSLNLIRPDGSIADSVSYEKAPLGHSYSKAKEEWIWSETLTPGSANISPFLTSDYEKNEASKEEPKENSKTENGEAAIVKQIQNLPGLSSFFPIPAALAVFSGIIILALKRKLKTG